MQRTWEVRTYDLLRKSVLPAGQSQKRETAVAIYHASTKPISRSAGRSAIAAAAYRAAVKLIDQRTGLVHDYTRKGGVVSAEIILPNGATAERAALWNAAEAAEKRKDARTAREWLVALPAELDAAQRADLARSFGAELAQRYGVAVDVAIHLPDHAGDNRNHHAHILTTTRTVSQDRAGGVVLGEKASIELSDKARRAQGLGPAADEVKAVRQLWEGLANVALERAGQGERIDCRSLVAQGIDREATTHLGPVATDMERRGVASDRGDGNRQVQANNDERQKLKGAIVSLQEEREVRALRQADPARVVQQWDRLYQAEHLRVRQRAERISRKVGQAIQAQEHRERLHRLQKPNPPSGLFRVFKRSAYERAATLWEKAQDQLAKRLAQLSQRYQRVKGYTTDMPGRSPSRALALRKATEKAPALARAQEQAREALLALQRQRQEQERQQRLLKKRGRGR